MCGLGCLPNYTCYSLGKHRGFPWLCKSAPSLETLQTKDYLLCISPWIDLRFIDLSGVYQAAISSSHAVSSLCYYLLCCAERFLFHTISPVDYWYCFLGSWSPLPMLRSITCSSSNQKASGLISILSMQFELIFIQAECHSQMLDSAINTTQSRITWVETVSASIRVVSHHVSGHFLDC